MAESWQYSKSNATQNVQIEVKRIIFIEPVVRFYHSFFFINNKIKCLQYGRTLPILISFLHLREIVKRKYFYAACQLDRNGKLTAAVAAAKK